MLTEWVLVSLPNFTRRAPLSHSIWWLFSVGLSFPHFLHTQGVCPASSSLPLQTHGCKQCSPTSNIASQQLPQVLHRLPPPPHLTRTSACSAWQRRTSTRACPTRGRRRSSSRPSSPWPRQAVLMQICSPRWSIEVKLQANCRPFLYFQFFLFREAKGLF